MATFTKHTSFAHTFCPTRTSSMDLELQRVDYTALNVTLQHSLKLLPGTSPKQQQKVVIGDQNGVIQLFSIKKNEYCLHFATPNGPKVCCIQLGGALGTVPDKIFVASDNIVRGFNKKGKLFLAFDTNLTEPIQSMGVHGNDLIVCGAHVYNHYKDLKESGSYLCGDTIVDVALLCPNNTSRIITVLACSGRVLRILEHCRMRKSVEVESVPTVLHVPKGIGDRVLCGFSDGKVLMFKINPLLTDVQEEVVINDSCENSAITCLDTFDMSGDGREELIIGRRDGTVQIFTFSHNEEIDIGPAQIYKDNFNESISCLQGGCVGANGYNEVVISTYSGKIIGLTTQKLGAMFSYAAMAVLKQAEADTPKQAKMKAELEELEKAVMSERATYQLSAQAMTAELLPFPILNISESLVLLKEEACYLVSIEAPTSLEFVVLQSDVPIELVDMERYSENMSYGATDPLNNNYLLATYRFPPDSNRVDFKFRSIEGQNGTLELYVTPNLQPKCCELKRIPIRPLALHMRTHTFDEKRPFNKLTLKGPFSQAEMHNWIFCCIPEVPEKLQSNERCVFSFKNVFIGTILMCEYGKSDAEFRSDNITTISILKDYLTKEATLKRIKLEISTFINDATIPHLLKLIEPKLLTFIQLKKDYKLLEVLLDLEVEDEEGYEEVLSQQYLELLKHKTDVEDRYKREPSQLNRIYGILTDLYIDKFKFKGANVKARIPKLIELFDNYDFDEIVTYYGGGRKPEIED